MDGCDGRDGMDDGVVAGGSVVRRRVEALSSRTGSCNWLDRLAKGRASSSEI